MAWSGAATLPALALAAVLAMPAAAQPPPAREATMELLSPTQANPFPPAIMLSVPSRAVPRGGFPLVLLLLDEGGPGPRTDAYALRLLENGMAVAEPYGDDDATPGTLAEMLAVLRNDARLDMNRAMAVGLGAGARTALRGWAAGAPVGALALFYPGCDPAVIEVARRARPATHGTAVLLMHGDADPANPPEGCGLLADALAVTARPTRQVLAGATYAWDAIHLVPPGASLRMVHPALPDGPRVMARPNAWMTQLAADRLLAFFGGVLRPGGP